MNAPSVLISLALRLLITLPPVFTMANRSPSIVVKMTAAGVAIVVEMMIVITGAVVIVVIMIVVIMNVAGEVMIVGMMIVLIIGVALIDVIVMNVHMSPLQDAVLLLLPQFQHVIVSVLVLAPIHVVVVVVIVVMSAIKKLNCSVSEI